MALLSRPMTLGRTILVVLVALLLPACEYDGNGTATTSTSAGPASTSSSITTTGGLRLALDGLGSLRLGVPQAAAERTGLIGAVGPGCEFSGTTGADLLPPSDDSTEEVFGILLVRASKGDASYTFVFNSGDTQATSVAVPGPSLCD